MGRSELNLEEAIEKIGLHYLVKDKLLMTQ